MPTADAARGGYRALAPVYDRLTADLDPRESADFVEACFKRYLPARPRLVLDLACGTGRVTFALADRGYDLIGIDTSEDMLAQAARKQAARSDRLFLEACARLGLDPDGDRTEEAVIAAAETPSPLFLQQDMRDFELYGTVEAVVSFLDGVNYLCGDGDLEACLRCVRLYLQPGGLFLFDVNTPYKFARVYGDNAYILEDEADGDRPPVYCGWQNAFRADTGLCRFFLTVFTGNPDGSYRRADEEQTERCYGEGALRKALRDAGFDCLGFFSDTAFSPAAPDAERWYVVAARR